MLKVEKVEMFFEIESSFVKAERKACEIGCKWKMKSRNCILDLAEVGKFKILDKKNFLSVIWKLKMYKGHG